MNKLLPYIKFLLFWSIIGSIGCVPTYPQLNGSHRMFIPLPPIEPRPQFILDVEPEENSSTDFRQYKDKNHFNNNICIELDLWHIAQSGDTLSSGEMALRSDLLVNRREMPLDSELMVATLTIFEIDGQETQISGPVTLCWEAQIPPGLHLAHLTIKQTDGNVLSYRWNFIISK